MIEGVGGFDTGKLKHTETQEKNPLPDVSGKYIIYIFNICTIQLFLFLKVFAICNINSTNYLNKFFKF